MNIQGDLWDELSEEQKASVKRARYQLAQGLEKTHKEVMKKTEEYLKSLLNPPPTPSSGG